MDIDTSPAMALELIKEYKLQALIGGAEERLEASGVCEHNGFFYIIFDNLPHILRLSSTLVPNHPDTHWFRQRGEGSGYEDITYHPGEQRFYVLIESLPFDATTFKARVEAFDEDFHYLESSWLDFAFEMDNKGLEGLVYIRRNDQDYLLGVCEGNRCKGGQLGRKPGGGRIQIFQKGPAAWEHRGTIKLPKSVLFEDYASLAISDNWVAVASQATSALWIGQLKETGWEWVDDGIIYSFPRSKKGNTIYCNVEGIAWVTPQQIVVVSDRFKIGEQPKKCQEKDQSIHLFNIPGR